MLLMLMMLADRLLVSLLRVVEVLDRGVAVVADTLTPPPNGNGSIGVMLSTVSCMPMLRGLLAALLLLLVE
jgi:hypothetical protein